MTARSQDVQIAVNNAVLAGTLLLPAGNRLHPCLLLISGSGAHDRDERVCGHTPFKVIAEYFVAHGYAVLRCDDRGVGDSTGKADSQDFYGSVADVVAIFRWLAGHAAINPEKIVLAGHSEGGLVAASASQHVAAWKIIMLASPAIPIDKLLHEQARMLSLESGATPAQIKHERQMNERVFDLAQSDILQSEVSSEIQQIILTSLRSWPEIPQIDENTINENAKIMADIVSAPAYRSLLKQNPAAILGRVRQPLFAVYGGKDGQVPGESNMAAFRSITSHNQFAHSMLFPKHNHLFQIAVTGSISEYESLPSAPDEQVLRAMLNWLALEY